MMSRNPTGTLSRDPSTVCHSFSHSHLLLRLYFLIIGTYYRYRHMYMYVCVLGIPT